MSQASLKIDLASIPGMVVLSNSNGEIIHVNQNYIERSGFTCEEIIGRPLTFFWQRPHESYDTILNHLNQQSVWHTHIRHQRKEGPDFQEIAAISKLPPEGREGFRLLKVGHPIDIPDYPANKTASATTNPPDGAKDSGLDPSLYPSIVDAAPYSIILIRLSDLRYIMVNEALCRKTGYARENILGKKTTELNLLGPTAAIEGYIEKLRRHGRVKNMEVELSAKDGRTVEALLSSRIIRIAEQEYILSISADITELKRPPRALMENEESYRTILKTAPTPITITRLSDGCYLEVNDAFIQRTGYRREEIIGRTAPELNLYDQIEDRQRLSKLLQQQGYVDDIELRLKDRYGNPLESLVSVRPIRYKGEECLLYISSKIDTLKAVQKTLAEREANYRTILNMAPYTIVITRRSDGVYMEANKAFTLQTGYSLKETLGRTPLDLNIYAAPADRDRLIDILQKKGRVDTMEVPFRAKDGHIIHTLVSLAPIHYQGEDCLIAMTVDINALKETQQALKESESRFRAIFETAADPIFLNDMETGRFMDVNHAACRHLGYEKPEFLNMSLSDIQSSDGIDPLTYLIKNPNRKSGFFFESLHFRKDGTQAVVEVSSQQMIHKNRMVLLSLVRDVTQRKQAESELTRYRKNLEKIVAERTQELKAAQDELVKKEKLAVLGQLTATVSHELRNPLGVIRSSNFFLQRKVPRIDEKTEKHFRRIDDQISICDAIVTDLLEYTRGRQVSVVYQEIAAWLEEIVSIQQEQLDIPLNFHIARPLPKIAYDQEKLRRVIINLLNNAVQAVNNKADESTEQKGGYQPQVTIRACLKGENLMIEVLDNGIGMDQKTLSRAFEPLFTTRARGTGIGLAIVKKIVAEHGGNIDIQSRLGDGTQARLSLPCPKNHPNPLRREN